MIKKAEEDKKAAEAKLEELKKKSSADQGLEETEEEKEKRLQEEKRKSEEALFGMGVVCQPEWSQVHVLLQHLKLYFLGLLCGHIPTQGP